MKWATAKTPAPACCFGTACSVHMSAVTTRATCAALGAPEAVGTAEAPLRTELRSPAALARNSSFGSLKSSFVPGTAHIRVRSGPEAARIGAALPV